jgi:DNA ligase-1
MHTCGMKDGIGYALRFPRLVGFVREDKKPEDSTSVGEIEEMYGMQKRVKMEAEGEEA